MIWHHKKTFLTQPQPFGFHCGCCHLKRLSGSHFVCKQRITTIKHMSDGVTLVFPERNFRVHTDKVDVGTIVFARSVAVEQFVVLLHQCNAPLGVLPDPVGESIFDYLLFLLRQHGVRFVQDALRSAFFIFNGIIDTVDKGNFHSRQLNVGRDKVNTLRMMQDALTGLDGLVIHSFLHESG